MEGEDAASMSVIGMFRQPTVLPDRADSQNYELPVGFAVHSQFNNGF